MTLQLSARRRREYEAAAKRARVSLETWIKRVCDDRAAISRAGARMAREQRRHRDDRPYVYRFVSARAR